MKPPFRILYAEPCFGSDEANAVAAAFSAKWLGMGRECALLEQRLAEFLGRKHVLLVNSGSSANLLAVLAADLPAGSECITTAWNFPTCISPLHYARLRTRFVDVSLEDYTPSAESIRNALTDQTKMVFVTHPLGMPVNLDAIRKICDENRLFLIEDSCDSLGARWSGRPVGWQGNAATFSFYASHHITCAGQGGAVAFSDTDAYLRAKSLRDWGRLADTEEGPDVDRFNSALDGVPYDARYVYDTMGFNLRLTEPAAAFGNVQWTKLARFIAVRNQNHRQLRDRLQKLSSYLQFPSLANQAEPAWFGFPMIVRPDQGVSRTGLANALERAGVQTRMMFAGDVRVHPGFAKLDWSAAEALDNSRRLLEHGLWVGVHPALSQQDLDYMADVIVSHLHNL